MGPTCLTVEEICEASKGLLGAAKGVYEPKLLCEKWRSNMAHER